MMSLGVAKLKLTSTKPKLTMLSKNPWTCIIVCVKKNGWYKHVICNSTSINFWYKYNSYLSEKSDISTKNVR